MSIHHDQPENLKAGMDPEQVKITATTNGEKDKKNSIASNKSGKYPKIVFLIILNEFCERFSYYGIRTVLYIYLTNFLSQSKESATVIYHAFTFMCYFTPLLGAILADGFIGLYGTILGLSVLYFVGELILTLTSMAPLGAPNLIGPCIGLFIIAVGTGGIKPCVSAFGGNQFGPSQSGYLTTFFSVFYLSINVGSLFGTFLTPMLRSDIKCYGKDCYPLAFGVPSVFMLLAVLFFLIGTKYYVRAEVNRSNGNIIVRTFLCIESAIFNRFFGGKKEGKFSHWLDYADSTKYGGQLVADVKVFCKILLVFVPLPMFWALFDQMGSSWTSQAQQLNGRVTSSWTIKPDQFQALNPVYIVTLVPIFDAFIYPAFKKVNLLKGQLQRMGVGMLVTALAFLLSALLEARMQGAANALNRPDRFEVLNLAPCDLTLRDGGLALNQNQPFLIRQTDYLKNEPVSLPFDNNYYQTNKPASFVVDYKCGANSKNASSLTIDISEESQFDLPAALLFQFNSTKNELTYQFYKLNENKEKPSIGYSEVKAMALGFDEMEMKNLQLKVINKEIAAAANFEFLQLTDLVNSSSSFKKIDYSSYKVQVVEIDDKDKVLFEKDPIFLETTAKYSLFVYSKNSTHLDMAIVTDVHPNGLHLVWQLIQIFVMTIAEIMVSISGLSFAFSQAPASMKSVVQAAWLLTVAVGNLIVVVIAEAKFIKNQVYEFIFYAGLIGVATLVFILIANFYKYEKENDSAIDDDNKNNKSES